MKKVFLIHGFDSSPNGGWRPYLMTELEKKDIYACALPMPKPAEPILSEWMEEIHRNVEVNIADDIYLVGHSLGGTTILRYVEKYKCSNIKGVIIVSAPCHCNNNDKIKDFLIPDLDWSKLKGKIKKVVVIQGDDDPVVPMSDAEEISRELSGELVVIPGGKHLNGSAGFTKLPEALDALLKILV